MDAIDEIKRFVTTYDGFGPGSGDGCGNGNGFGSGYGDGHGHGHGYGNGYSDGNGNGNGNGYGDGDGSGNGDGYGYGDGSGSGSGDGDGYGHGHGHGYGYDIKSINGQAIYNIDGVQTIITHIHNDIAQGYMLLGDLSMKPCYVVKGNNQFAHGDTLREAYEALSEKLYDNSTVEERIEAFMAAHPSVERKYPAADLFRWHHNLTGSCKAGREAFCRERGIDIDKDEFTVTEFIELTIGSYGGGIIKQLKYAVQKRKDTDSWD